VITRVRGIRVGHATDLVGATGCTVVLAPPGTIGSGVQRGGAPGTRETDLLRPGTLVEEVHAVLLTGGSAFGLAAADGVMRYLEERGVGFDAWGVARVPIVPAAVVFDLGVGDARARPGPQAGYDACAAATDGAVAEGSVGAGTGATVGKLHGPERAVKGGVGTASAQRDGVIVGALVAVNAMGEVLDESGEILAGARPGPGEGDEPGPERSDPGASPAPAPRPSAPPPPAGPNTVIGAVATNARLSKERARLLALAGHHGIATAVRPAHTMWDGDTIFSLATGEMDAPQGTVEELAEDAVAGAIRRAVRLAEGLAGVPAIGGSA
jgi:L-aminopeptidase/D-esterase-like protein